MLDGFVESEEKLIFLGAFLKAISENIAANGELNSGSKRGTKDSDWGPDQNSDYKGQEDETPYAKCSDRRSGGYIQLTH